MSLPLNLDRLHGVVAVLETMTDLDQFCALQKLVLNNGGQWDLPSAQQRDNGEPAYAPAIVSIQVFEVFAAAERVEHLPAQWMANAKAMLDAADDRSEAAA